MFICPLNDEGCRNSSKYLGATRTLLARFSHIRVNIRAVSASDANDNESSFRHLDGSVLGTCESKLFMLLF